MTRLAEHQYQCPEHGFVVKTGVYPIRCLKQCPRQPSPSAIAAQMRAQIEAKLQSTIKQSDAQTLPWEAIHQTLDRCFGGCAKFDRGCTVSGIEDRCRANRLWLKTLLFHGCRGVNQEAVAALDGRTAHEQAEPDSRRD